ncbi:GNAT family N-acetyltransferase [Prochlorococcus sp. MIT 1223]|uniref:GNAT family N-acetyltransferase n=1 Tax=Prochlorococcus sp. MIT 1223 TaxID=3096217 RepID=UPI002A749352|nr:GNAT family N-acetyltransferase [Prochlorococcus sp. MIT 1223]
MTGISIVRHGNGSPGLRYFGLGPNLRPSAALKKLQELLQQNTFWAKNRSHKALKIMLSNSSVVISIWKGTRLVGFGRANSDGIFRATLWDVVIANDSQGLGIGRILVEALLKAPQLQKVEKVYLMTTNCSEFYEQLGFKIVSNQKLLLIQRDSLKQ